LCGTAISSFTASSNAFGGYLWDFVSPEIAFTVAAVIGIIGTGYFLVFGEEFDVYR